MNRPFLLSLILTIGLASPSYSRETQETIALHKTIPLQCISLTNQFGVKVILSKQIVTDLTRQEPKVLDLSDREIRVHSDRAVELLKSLGDTKDEFGCQTGVLTYGEPLYLVARLIKSGNATILSTKSNKPETEVIYRQSYCGRSNPAGFINITTNSGKPVVLMLLSCIT